jgi:flavin reductase (DIM6/NTAB) family NADH-FMN oxidoreductase RutF
VNGLDNTILAASRSNLKFSQCGDALLRLKKGAGSPPHRVASEQIKFHKTGSVIRGFCTSISRLADISRASSPDVFHEEAPAISHAVRLSMRHIPHSVVVITSSLLDAVHGSTQSTSPPSSPSSFRGMTVSSFTTVTLSPCPIVSFSVRLPSATAKAILESGLFTIHFLSATEAGQGVAEAFTRGGGASAFDSKAFIVKEDRGVPILESKGVMKRLRCRIWNKELVAIGDHIVLFGEVMELEDCEGHGSNDVTGLVYVDGKYVLS